MLHDFLGLGLGAWAAAQVVYLHASPDTLMRRLDGEETVERPLLETVLARTDGNQIRAAALQGMNRTSSKSSAWSISNAERR